MNRKPIKIRVDTFGSAEQYKMLPYIASYLNNIEDDNKKRYFCNLITRISKVCNDFEKLNISEDYKRYFIELIRNDYNIRLDNLEEKNEKIFMSYIRNYVHARIENTRKKMNLFYPQEITTKDGNTTKARYS